jgi:hypothetical protein
MKNLTIAMILGITATTAVVALTSAPAQAANLSFVGNLDDENDIKSFFFTVDAPATVNFVSYGVDGGTNAAGNSIASGGFPSTITLFDPTDLWLEDRDSGLADFNFDLNLAPGTYRAVISAFRFSTPGTNFADGFTTPGTFFGGSSAYAFDINNVSPTTTAVPEPADFIGTAIAGAIVVGWKRKLVANNRSKSKL